MNERIKELYGNALDKAVPYTWHNLDHIEVEKIMKELAELIVRECRDIVGKTRDQAIEDEWNVDEAMSTAMFDIEEHFGVEE